MPKLHCLPPGSSAPGSKTLIFIRHGETVFNVACTDSAGRKGSKCVGGPDGTMSKDPFAYEDSPLTPTGQQQTESLGAAMAQATPSVELVVASPLERTLQTAAGVFPSPPGGGKIVAHEGVREMMFAKYESYNKRGLKSAKAARFPQVDFGLVAAEEDAMFAACAASHAGRERSAEVQTRVSKFLEWLMGRPENVIAVVSHGFTMGLTFGSDHIHKVFEVDALDVDACTLKGIANTATHEVVISRQASPGAITAESGAADALAAGRQRRAAVTRSTVALVERDEKNKNDMTKARRRRGASGGLVRLLQRLGIPVVVLAIALWVWCRRRQ
jgi:broad specificity phosphatase PhoE